MRQIRYISVDTDSSEVYAYLQIQYTNGDLTSKCITVSQLANFIELADEADRDNQSETIEGNYLDDCYDDGQALTSAGFGTDEDYGSYGDSE